MSDARAAVLAGLAARPGQPQHGLDLARHAGLSSGTLYPILVRLQRADRIEASWSAGRRAYRAAAALFLPLRTRVAEGLGPHEAEVRDALVTLRTVLDRLRDAPTDEPA